jgi:1-acyl-sn-glycerol-3-phosphate acyltransferase
MIPPALAKLGLPLHPVRRIADSMLNGLATGWVRRNSWWMLAVGNQRWDVTGTAGLHARGWYLVSPNHQSWVDILVLQRVFDRKIPFLKFFLKQELIWVPVIGLAWWALDFPFMKRGGSRGAQASDMAATRRACEKFKVLPTSVINFVEGTRLTDVDRVKTEPPHTPVGKVALQGFATVRKAIRPRGSRSSVNSRASMVSWPGSKWSLSRRAR